MSWEYSRASRMYTQHPYSPSHIADRKNLNHVLQVCHKDRARPTIRIGDYHLIYEKTRTANNDILIVIIIWVYFKNVM